MLEKRNNPKTINCKIFSIKGILNEFKNETIKNMKYYYGIPKF